MIEITNILQQEHKLTVPLQYTQSQDPVLAPDMFGTDSQRAPEYLVFFPKLRMQIPNDTVTQSKIG